MLAPALGLDLADLRYEHVSRLQLRRGVLPIVDRLVVSFPPRTRLEAEPGDEVRLELDGGEGAEAVFRGQLTAVHRGSRCSRITAHGPALQLALARPAASLEKVSVAEIIEHLCGEAEVDCTVDGGNAQTALFVSEGRSSALEWVSRLLASAGLRAAFDGEGMLVVGEHGSNDDVALRYGREVVDFSAGQRLADPNTAYVAGEGGGEPDSDEGLWVASDFAAGGRTDAGTGVRWRSEPLMRTVDDAGAAAESWTASGLRRAAPVRLRCWLLPQIGPGARVEIQDVPEHAPLSECRVRQVVHRLRPGGRGDEPAQTELWATAHTQGAGGLAGALGGLL